MPYLIFKSDLNHDFLFFFSIYRVDKIFLAVVVKTLSNFSAMTMQGPNEFDYQGSYLALVLYN